MTERLPPAEKAVANPVELLLPLLANVAVLRIGDPQIKLPLGPAAFGQATFAKLPGDPVSEPHDQRDVARAMNAVDLRDRAGVVGKPTTRAAKSHAILDPHKAAKLAKFRPMLKRGGSLQ